MANPQGRRILRLLAAAARIFLLCAVTCAAARAADAQPPARIAVDAREAPRGIMSAHLILPVSAGPLTLVYPKWLPGRHSPAGPLTSLGGQRFTADGQTAAVAARFDRSERVSLGHTQRRDAPRGGSGNSHRTRTGRRGAGTRIAASRDRIAADPGMESADALPRRIPQRRSDLPGIGALAARLEIRHARSKTTAPGPERVEFAPVSLTTLMDSTLLAGRYFRDMPLGGTPAVTLHIAADTPVALNMSSETAAHYRQLVREAAALFGATHYDHYDFLWSLTDQIMPDGLEHHESSDNRSPLRALVDDPIRRAEANLLPHEYVHSWNGKFRRPAGLATPNYQEPMIDEMLWVYEGLTEYLGDVLAARSGLLTEGEFRDEFARIARGDAVAQLPANGAPCRRPRSPPRSSIINRAPGRPGCADRTTSIRSPPCCGWRRTPSSGADPKAAKASMISANCFTERRAPLRKVVAVRFR